MSVTQTSGMYGKESMAETSERDFVKDMEREDMRVRARQIELEEMKRRTQQIQSPTKKGVSFVEEESESEQRNRSNDTRQRPRADQVMGDLELPLDLGSEEVSRTLENSETQSKRNRKTGKEGVLSPKTSIAPLKKPRVSPAGQHNVFRKEKEKAVTYNDFLSK